jgi:N-acetylglucosamine transport system permease protein
MRQGKYPFVIGFLAAPVTLYLVFVIWPYIQTFQISLTNWNGFSAPQFVGLDNFTKLFQDNIFWKAISHHVLMLVALPLVTITVALFFSFLLNLGGKLQGGQLRGVGGSAFYKVVFFLPQVLALAIVGVVFSQVYQQGDAHGSGDGVINAVLRAVHLPTVGFITDPHIAMGSMIGVMIWQAVGFYVVLFSAGMASIPKELFEAAALDGADRSTLFFKVTLPLLWDTLQVGWIYLGIAAFDGFAIVQVMSVDQGGPDHSTTVLPLEIWRNGFNLAHQGYASAMGVVLFFATLTFAAIAMRVTKRDSIEF